jgi:pyruvate-ferredoxin/flavodoxin oxidoreductase
MMSENIKNTKKETVTMDGNEAAAHIAYAFTEVAAIYPITPSSPMAGKTDAWSAKGKKNIFGQPVTLVEMQSEAGAAAAVHGALESGALATSFTSSQGLMLMIPVMHRISGQLHPGVLHVASRTVGTHAFSIFGDHSDVMNCRQTGFAMLSTASVQEIMDISAAAHLAAIESRVPFLHFFDGFRTSHEIDKVELMPYEALAPLVNYDALEAFRAHALNPEHPLLRSTVQNPDIYFQVREASNSYYDSLPDIVEKYLGKLSDICGREYHLFNYYGDENAEDIIIAMGSVSGTVKETVDYLNAKGRRVGFLQVHLFRPFSFEYFRKSIPATARRIAVLDRCKEMGAAGEPLYQDVRTAFYDDAQKGTAPLVIGGRYGLSSKDTDPGQIIAVFDNLASENPKNGFTIGIEDDVTHHSLAVTERVYPDDDKYAQLNCKFWGLGSDGTVGANKSTVEIVSQHTDKYGQAYFEYDAKKSFGVTKSHLRFSDHPIRSGHFVKHADFLACHNPTYIFHYDMLCELKENGTFLLACPWSAEELEEKLPTSVKRALAAKKANFYVIDAAKIAAEYGLGNHTNMVLQSAFFHLSGLLPIDEAMEYMKAGVRKMYFAKGEDVVNSNIAAIEASGAGLVKIEIPSAWSNVTEAAVGEDNRPDVVKNILEPINAQKGDDLPVSAFKGYEDGAIEMGLTAYEKRAIATKVPVWDPTACLQCNRCSYVCPHAVIRPYLLDERESANAPENMKLVPAKGVKGLKLDYTLQISRDDCTGCSSCVNCCPAKGKAIKMVAVKDVPDTADAWEYGLNISEKSDVFDVYTVKGSQFKQPLLEFSAACAGCGETPYAKLLTQLVGDRVYWANATGCSQAWGSPMPGIPYTTNKKGYGPAWSNSLFENNAEFSLGMCLSVKMQRQAELIRAKRLRNTTDNADVIAALDAWISEFDSIEGSRKAGDALVSVLESCALAGDADRIKNDILMHRDQLAKKSFWMFGGDGWAYDIGFGGLDHVLAQGEPVKVFIVDTEVYSNTGGQSSKATPLGAVAQFCASGKKSPKKDLGAILMTYGNVYVAQVAMGADYNQTVKAIKEAEAFDGPAVIIAYTPCASHGIRGGLGNAQMEMKRAVDAGYWKLYRFDPSKEQPLTLDSGEPSMKFEDFLMGEVRYASLTRTFPENAKQMFKEAGESAARDYEKYKNMQ